MAAFFSGKGHLFFAFTTFYTQTGAKVKCHIPFLFAPGA
jgi:hypothetical protein